MNSTEQTSPDTGRPVYWLGLRPATVGTFLCVFSAVLYTVANACLRQLAGMGADPVWSTCNKELVTVVAVGPWVLWQVLRRRPALPAPKTLALLILVGLIVQLCGNLACFWAFGVVGLGVSVAVMLSAMLTGSAILGRIMLGEHVARRTMAAIGVLMLSLVLLAMGTAAVGKAIVNTTDPGWLMLGLAAAILAGSVFALLSITIRHNVTNATPVTTVVVIITGAGVVALGPLAVWRLGIQGLLDTSPQQYAWMLAAGGFNLFAFLAISKGLQLTPVVNANVLNASQVALSAVAGVMLFGEPLGPWLVAGVVLTIVGMSLLGHEGDEQIEVDQHA